MMKNILCGFILLECVSGSAMNIGEMENSRELILDFFKDKAKDIAETKSFCCARIKEVRKNIQKAIKDGYCDGILAKECQFALKCFDDFESSSAKSNLLEILIKITNNGFYDSSNFYISTRFKEDRYAQKDAMLLLDSVWTLLWQMREVLDVILVATDLNAISDLLNDRIFVSSFLMDRFNTGDICCRLEENFAQ